jgi:hypothetical protein
MKRPGPEPTGETGSAKAASLGALIPVLRTIATMQSRPSEGFEQGTLGWHRILCSKVHSQEPCNYDYYDHDADDVKNVHCALRRMHARLRLEVTMLRFVAYPC